MENGPVSSLVYLLKVVIFNRYEHVYLLGMLSTYHFAGFSNGFPMVFQWFSYGSNGFPMVFLWFSNGFPMVSYGFPMVFQWFPMVFPWFSNGFPMGFPMVFLWFSNGFPMDVAGYWIRCQATIFPDLPRVHGQVVERSSARRRKSLDFLNGTWPKFAVHKIYKVYISTMIYKVYIFIVFIYMNMSTFR